MIIHMCLSVRGALRWPKRMKKRLLVDEAGRNLTPEEVDEALMDELSKGHEVLPLGGNPCEGFDYKKGCPGHEKRIKLSGTEAKEQSE